jgi:hypothetical protein
VVPCRLQILHNILDFFHKEVIGSSTRNTTDGCINTPERSYKRHLCNLLALKEIPEYFRRLADAIPSQDATKVDTSAANLLNGAEISLPAPRPQTHLARPSILLYVGRI